MEAVVLAPDAPEPESVGGAVSAPPSAPRLRPGILTKSLKFTQLVAGSNGPVAQGSVLLVKWAIENGTFMPKRFQVVVEDHGPDGSTVVQSTGKELLRGRNSIGGTFQFPTAALGPHQVIGRLLQAPPILVTFEQDRRVLDFQWGGPAPAAEQPPVPAGPTAPGTRKAGITVALNMPAKGTAPTNLPDGVVADGPRSVKSPSTGMSIQW